MNIITLGSTMQESDGTWRTSGLQSQVNHAGTAVTTLARTPANAFDEFIVAQLHEHITWLTENEQIASVVITGSGKWFASGADVELLTRLDVEQFGEFVLSVQQAFERLERLDKPTIAAINGPAVGGGLELALACDIRFCASNAVLGLPEVRLGLLPGAGGTQRLPRTIGRSRAFDLLLTGRLVDSREAQRLGLVDEVCEGDVLATAVHLADELSAGARGAQRAIKRCILAGFPSDRSAGLAAELEEIVRLRSSEDAREGLESFREKRQPHFGT